MSRFRREFLPDSLSFYRSALGQMGRPNGAGWCACCCPFHNSKSGKSFAVHIDGAFVCRGCGVKGGDIISFLRQRDALGFKEACQQLGCWDEDGKPAKVRPGPLVRYLVMDFIIDGVQYRAHVKDEPKSEIELLRRFHAEAKDCLSEIRHGDAERFEGEEEAQWGILANSCELIQMQVTNAR